MSEDKSHIDFPQLVSRYLSGQADDSEVKLLEEWVLSSPEHRDQFKALRDAWILAGMQAENQDVDVDAAWKTVAGEVFPEDKVRTLPSRSKSRVGWMVRFAAAAIVLLLASVWLVRYLDDNDRIEMVARAEVAVDMLPDGTQIALNRDASIVYAYDEEQGIRRVELQGDAFFEVERDTARPFVVAAENVRVEVLGTAFYVDARPDQPEVQVIVQSGSVAFAAGTEQVQLAAAETGVYDKTTGQLSKAPNDDRNYLAWRTEVLVFERTPLDKVVFDLNRVFHGNISIGSSEIRNCEITATFDHQSFDAIVRIIEQTLNIRAERVDGGIVFRGDGCE